MKRSEQRVYCWIRQQRYLLEVHQYIYFVMDDQILDDLQYDYIKKRLEVVEQRWLHVMSRITDHKYVPLKYYADVIIHPSVQRRATTMLRRWIRTGRPGVEGIRYMTGEISKTELYRDALRTIVRYPIEHL